jgi:hypothetical protein
MKKETLQYANITVVEIWKPTMMLRNVNRIVSSSNFHCESGMFLQQLWTSNLGNQEWRDIPVEIES